MFAVIRILALIVFWLGVLAGSLKRILQRGHANIALLSALVMVFTFELDFNYAIYQRDLYLWRKLLGMNIDGAAILSVSFLIVSLVIKVAIIMAVISLNLYPTGVLNYYLAQRSRQQYASFILRRLLMQLELAMVNMPHTMDLQDAQNQQAYQEAKAAAYCAVDLFRRDATKLLVDGFHLSDEELPFFVLEEEELDLERGGYGNVEVNITRDLISRLLYPERA